MKNNHYCYFKEVSEPVRSMCNYIFNFDINNDDIIKNYNKNDIGSQNN